MKTEDLRATLISLKTYVEEAEEKCRVVRLELASVILEIEKEEDEKPQAAPRCSAMTMRGTCAEEFVLLSGGVWGCPIHGIRAPLGRW